MVNPRPAPFFIGEDLALDFLNSVGRPWGVEIDWLTDGPDLLLWLGQAHAVPQKVLNGSIARWGVEALDVTATQARGLREWFRAFVYAHAGQTMIPVAEEALGPLNLLLQTDDAYRQIGTGTSGDALAEHRHPLRWRDERRWRDPTSLLLPIAQAIGSLICDKDFALVRSCHGPHCTMWFYDVSKAHTRRWCSMAVCGNRAKAAAHRARSRKL